MRNHHRPRERDLLSETRDQGLSPDDDEEEDEGSVIYTARRTRSHPDINRHTSTRVAKDSRASGFSAVLSMSLGWRKPKSEQITTAPGQLGAGETETEADEPVSTHRCFSGYALYMSYFDIYYSRDIFQRRVSYLSQSPWFHQAL
jgi:hypothetical protein